MREAAKARAVCVMGGSFNPPTLAHLRLMLAALEALDAEAGVFVPANRAYVERKMKRGKARETALPEALRLEMLRALCREDPRLSADGLEFGRGGGWRTFETMEALQEKHPQAALWFIAGGDKLDVIPRWHRSEDFLRRFHILAVDREGVSSEAALRENPVLAQNRDRFRIMTAPEGLAGVSSSRVRALLRRGDESAAELVHPAVWDLLLAEGCLAREITVFRGDFDFLSNFFEALVDFGGIRYGSAEAAFQAQKCRTEEERLTFRDLRPGQAKRAGRQTDLRQDWEQVKTALMAGIVEAKFRQNPYLARRLLETGNLEIVEKNTWGDTCWGVDARTGQGENRLGRILMEVREELRRERDAGEAGS